MNESLPTAESDAGQKAAREALMDAADHLLPGDRVGADWLVYLAVTKYGRAEYDHAASERLIDRRILPPDPLLCPGDGCPGCFHCTSTNEGDDSDRATEPRRLVEPSDTASVPRVEGAAGAVGAPSPDAEVGSAGGRVGRGRAREVTRVLPPVECDGCLCPTEHDGDFGSSGHAGPCPPHTCDTPPGDRGVL